MSEWKLVKRLERGGHRLFQRDGRYAIADNSGLTPDPHNRYLVLQEGEVGVYVYLIDRHDEGTHTATGWAGALALAETLGFGLKVRMRAGAELILREPRRVTTVENIEKRQAEVADAKRTAQAILDALECAETCETSSDFDANLDDALQEAMSLCAEIRSISDE